MFQIKGTDKYTKLICAECTSSVYAFCWHKKVVDAGQRLLAERIQMAEQVIIFIIVFIAKQCGREGRHFRLYTAFIALLSVYTNAVTVQHVVANAPTFPLLLPFIVKLLMRRAMVIVTRRKHYVRSN